MGKERRERIRQVLQILAPKIPEHECDAVIDHAIDSVGLRKASVESAAWLSLVAYLRHQYTEYNALMNEGYDIDSARFFTRDAINEKLFDWGSKRKISSE